MSYQFYVNEAILDDYNNWLSERFSSTERIKLIDKYNTIKINHLDGCQAYDLCNNRDVVSECIYDKLDGFTKSSMITTCRVWSNWLLQKQEDTPKLFEEYQGKLQYKYFAEPEGDTYVTYRDGIEIDRAVQKNLVPEGYYEWEQANYEADQIAYELINNGLWH